MSWRAPTTSFEPDYIEHEVCGTVLKFYPVSLRCAFSLKVIAGPIAQALTALFDGKDDGDLKMMEYGTPGSEGMAEFGKETLRSAPPLEVIRFRQTSRGQSIQALLDTVGEHKNQIVLGRLIMDSLRETFPGKIDDKAVAEFMDDLKANEFAAMLVGVGKANAGVLGPLAPRVSKKLKDQIDETLNGNDLETQDQPDESSPEEQTDTRPKDGGDAAEEASASKTEATG